MRFLNCLALCEGFLLSYAAAQAFVPDKTGLGVDKYVEPLPVQYDLAGSQAYQANMSNSYWSASYVLGSNKHQYLVVSHLVAFEPGSIAVRRGSVLDITDPSVYGQFQTIETVPPSAAQSSGVNVKYDDYGFVSTTSDPLGPIRTWSTHEGASFDLTFELSSTVILNGGLGTFPWETTTANEWSIPAGVTTGTIKVGESIIKIDPAKSLTWYDRQFQPGGASQWTWFALQVTDPVTKQAEKYAIWFYPDGKGGNKGFATLRQEKGTQKVIPATFVTQGSGWTSPHTGNKYATAWKVNLEDKTSFNIKVIRDDQELHDPEALQANYEGYITATGVSRNGLPLSAYGLVEIQPPISLR